MAQWVKVLKAKSNDLSLILGPYSGRREPTLISCSLTSTFELWYICTNIHA